MQHVRLPDLQVTFNPDGSILARSGSAGIGVKAPPFICAILAACATPNTREQIAEKMGPQAAGVYDQLVEMGLLVDPDAALDTPVMFSNFAGIEVHRRMLNDEVRIQTYGAALKQLVKPTDVVIDAGSGTGVLAVLAALAGAKKVYAIEMTDMARVIPHVAEASGVGDRVEVIRGDMKKVEVPEKADLIVHELIGAWALAEGDMPDLGICAERNLKAGGLLVPGAITFWLAPLKTAPAILLNPFRKREDGVDLTPLLSDARGRAHLAKANPADVGEMVRVDHVTLPCGTAFSGEVDVQGPCEALVAWFDLHMAPDLLLPTGPADPPTHWHQSIIPLSLPEGRHRIRIEGTADPSDRRTMRVSFDGDGIRQDVHFR